MLCTLKLRYSIYLCTNADVYELKLKSLHGPADVEAGQLHIQNATQNIIIYASLERWGKSADVEGFWG